MFTPFEHEDPDLTAEIRRIHSHLSHLNPDTDEYVKTARQLSALYALRNDLAQLNLKAAESYASAQLDSDKHQLAVDAHQLDTEKHQLAVEAQQLVHDESRWQEEQAERPFYARISPDTALTVLGNVAIAVIVIKYEQTGVIGTKVMSFMRKF